MTVEVPEILNIDYNVGVMVLNYLNKYPTKKEAAEKLGISDRHLFNYIKMYKIVEKKVENKSVYSFSRKRKFQHYCAVII